LNDEKTKHHEKLITISLLMATAFSANAQVKEQLIADF
jgi:hypothetical protein